MEEFEKRIREAIKKATYLDATGDGNYTIEGLANYRDEISDESATDIVLANDPQAEFFDWLWRGYLDAEFGAIQEEKRKVKEEMERTAPLTDAQEEYLEDWFGEHVFYNPPADHFLDQELCVDIMLDTGDGNYDYVLNSCAYPCYYGEQGKKIDPKAAIVWLAKSQGYTKTQLQDALNDGDVANPKGFLASMRQELANLPSSMSTVTFLVKMTLRQLIKLNQALRWRDRDGIQYDNTKYPYCGYIVVGKECETGLYDPWDGGGSVLEIQLEKDVKIPIKFIGHAQPDCRGGFLRYHIKDVYGVDGSLWRDCLKEIHIPKKAGIE